jgi:hypothetical protein
LVTIASRIGWTSTAARTMAPVGDSMPGGSVCAAGEADDFGGGQEL